MRRVLRFLSIVAAATLALTACDKGVLDNLNKPDDQNPGNTEDPNNPNDPNDPNNPVNPGDDVEDSDLTPGQHKAKLEDIALEFVNYFNPADVEDICKNLSVLGEYIDNSDLELPIGNEEEDIEIDQGTLSADDVMKFATRVADQVVVDINDPDQNVWAGNCYTYNGYDWDVTSIDNSSFKFVWDNATLTVSWNNVQKVELYDSCEEVNYLVYVPKNIKCVMTINGAEHMALDITTNVADNNKTLNITVEAKLNGGYHFVCDNGANSKGVEVHYSISKNGKTLATATSVVAINDFTDIDNWYAEYEDEWGVDTYIDPTEYFVANVKTAKAQIDVLNFSLVAEGNLQGLNAEIENIYDRYSDGKKCYEAICNLVNERVQIIAVYNDTKEKVADVIMSVASESYDGKKMYYAEPILLFADGSKFAFDEYFTERAFGNLVERIEELAEQMDDML